MALEAVHIVSCVEETIADDYVAAVHDVDSVVVPIGLCIDMDPFHKDVTALVVLLVPATGIPERDVTDNYSFTFQEMDVFRTVAFL